MHQLLGGHIYNVVVVAQNCVKLRIHPGLYDLRRGLAVDVVHLVVDQFFQYLCGVFYLGRVEVLGQKLDVLHAVGDHAGICDDHLLCGLMIKIVEFPEHLICGAEKERAAAVGVVELLGCLQHPAVLLVLGVEKMNVAAGDDRLIKRPANVQYPAVIILQNGDVLHRAVIHKKAVVAKGLYLQIIVKRRDLFQRLVALAPHHRAVKLAHTAGRAHDYALPVLDEQAFGNGWGLVKVFQIRLRHHLIEIFKSGAVFHQQYHVPGAGNVRALEPVIHALHIVHSSGPLGF